LGKFLKSRLSQKGNSKRDEGYMNLPQMIEIGMMEKDTGYLGIIAVSPLCLVSLVLFRGNKNLYNIITV